MIVTDAQQQQAEVWPVGDPPVGESPGGEPVDDKAHIRDEIDLSQAEWERPLPEGVDPDELEDAVEIAFVGHTDGVTYTAMRQASDPDGTVLVFTPSEWEAFILGARDGEFDEPW